MSRSEQTERRQLNECMVRVAIHALSREVLFSAGPLRKMRIKTNQMAIIQMVKSNKFAENLAGRPLSSLASRSEETAAERHVSAAAKAMTGRNGGAFVIRIGQVW